MPILLLSSHKSTYLNMKFTTTIPVKSHLKKYLIKRLSAKVDVIFISKHTLIGKLIIKSFSERANRPKKTSDITDNINIVFDERNDLTLSDGNVFDFNQLIEDLYRRELGMFISVHFLFADYPERKQSIINFNNKIGITEDEIAIETLIKHLQRNAEDTEFFDFQ